MKKRLFALAFLAITLLVVVFSAVSCSCDNNYDFFDTNYTFTHAYVKIGEEWVDLEIKTWTDYEGEQIQLTLPDDTVMLVSSINCILYEGELPKGNR